MYEECNELTMELSTCCHSTECNGFSHKKLFVSYVSCSATVCHSLLLLHVIHVRHSHIIGPLGIRRQLSSIRLSFAT